MAPGELLQDLRLPPLELLPLEGPRDARPALLGQPLHGLAQRAPPPSRQLERHRPVGVFEVVDVAVVGRHWFGLGRAGQDPLHGRGLAGARGSEDEKVVASLAHADAEGRGARRAILADHAVERRQLGRGDER